MHGANPELVSEQALDRGRDQLGTLGSGNHFTEIGYVAEIYDESLARGLGIFLDQVTIIVHTGSRGLGHQVCDDYISKLLRAAAKYGFELPDRQLCCAPVQSPEGQAYLGAMAAAANFAFANRQIITHWVRETLQEVLGLSPRHLGLELVYDVAHNIAKIETHQVNGKKKRLCVHRKGATRAFPPHHPEVPAAYQQTGQPVLIPGDMGRYSYLLVGTQKGPGRNLRQHLPWRRPYLKSSSSLKGGQGTIHRTGIGQKRHCRAGSRPGHGGGRDTGGLQRCGAGGGGRPRGRLESKSGKITSSGGNKRLAGCFPW